MEDSIAAILKRVTSKGVSALDLLSVYADSDHAPLWREDPRLHQAFTRKLIAEGHPMRAFELAREGLARHASDGELRYSVALALARGGNLRGAKSQLTELLGEAALPTPLRIEALCLEGRLKKDELERARDLQRKAELARQSAQCYLAAAELDGTKYFPLINAATMSLLAGDLLPAKNLAERVIGIVEPGITTAETDYWALATLGEAYFLLSNEQQAAKYYEQAVELAKERNDVGSIASMRRNALLILNATQCNRELLRLFYVGSVVVFAGHMLDHPARTVQGGRPRRFPADPQLIRQVSQEIQRALDELNARVGFCSVACGSDILFAEHMLNREAELHIVLPFARQDFYATSVDFNAPQLKPWRARCDAVLERATQVHYATTEAYLGDDDLFAFANEFTQGLTLIRSAQRGVDPQAVVVFDGNVAGRVGGTDEFLRTWTDSGHGVKKIDLRSIREQTLGDVASGSADASPAAAIEQRESQRHVKAMLFADVKDFSKLTDVTTPKFFVRFLQEVDGVLRSLSRGPIFQNTWGDGLYLVFERVSDCAEAALRLLERAEKIDWKDLGINEETPVRIGIHAGPVFNGQDPIIGKMSYFGSHVTRAARIEPVTVPGCAFASEQFASLLTVEGGDAFVCEYIGIEQFAKGYDRCPLYRIARR